MKCASAVGLCLLAGLGACSPADTDPGPGGVTVGEAKALDEAAEMIEQRRLPPEAVQADESAAQPDPETRANP